MLKRNQMAVNFIWDTAHVPQHKVLSAMNSKASKNVDREENCQAVQSILCNTGLR